MRLSSVPLPANPLKPQPSYLNEYGDDAHILNDEESQGDVSDEVQNSSPSSSSSRTSSQHSSQLQSSPSQHSEGGNRQ